ncbi:hypothetical protein [Acidimangrovimonas pyrenivorans]|uniref:Transferrin-binding protein B C-lobe/N-lobe beta barrel domain-containing protein n=1 Tax=Acidimangrovimonas pyrenivorans TaxID=2030798 RepID=A0ABV7AD55_9RHOB
MALGAGKVISGAGNVIWMVLAAAALAGCGGGGTPTAQSSPATYYDSFLQPGYEAQRVFLDGDSATGQAALPNTAYKRMPTSGHATYKGYALLYANQTGAVGAAPRISLIGETTLTADFANARMTGEAKNFVGGEITDNATNSSYVFTRPPVYYDGKLTMSDGCIGTSGGCADVTRPNQFAGTMKGKLTGTDGNTVVTTARVQGDFRGTPIKGVFGQAINGPITVNGTPVSGALTITGKP